MKPNLEIAIIGLVGVVVGAVVTAGLTMIREWMSERKEQKKNSEYLAILVSSMLDMYVAGCAEVVSDDGLYHGERNADGYREIHSTAPSFEPLSVQVEWKSLPSKLMNEVLSFPLEIEAAKSKIEGAYEYEATPPDFDEYFAERQYQYALLGLRAFGLSSSLRRNARLPARSPSSWNPVEYMATEMAKHEKWRTEQEGNHAANPLLAL